jgi:hypothetical protein
MAGRWSIFVESFGTGAFKVVRRSKLMDGKMKFVWIVWPLTVCVLFQLSCTKSQEQEIAGDSQIIERGRYLVTIGGCHDCHTPKVFTDKGPVLDETRLLSGHPAEAGLPELDVSRIGPDGWILFNNHLTGTVGPWGASFAVNLTPDKETGIGRWTAEAFIESMRTGLHWGAGPPILPPMPWMNWAEAEEEDLRAMFAYLQSVEPIRNEVPLPLSLEELAER